jgi:hypothetical protein
LVSYKAGTFGHRYTHGENNVKMKKGIRGHVEEEAKE